MFVTFQEKFKGGLQGAALDSLEGVQGSSNIWREQQRNEVEFFGAKLLAISDIYVIALFNVSLELPRFGTRALN